MPPIPRRPCGSRQVWSPPSPGLRRSGRSRACSQRTQHRHQSRRVRAAADPYGYAVNLDFDPSSNGLDFATPKLPLRNSRRSHIRNRRHELKPVSIRTRGLSFSQLTSPAKQLLWRQSVASSYSTDRIPTRRDLRHNPSLLLITPFPPPSSAGKHFQPPDMLSVRIMVSVHSKPNDQTRPQTSRSGHHSEGGYRTALTFDPHRAGFFPDRIDP